MRTNHLLYILGLGILMWGCDGFFGVKTPTDFLDEPQFDNNSVAYVPIQPVWDNMIEPVDIIAGWDELIYVADAGSDEIIAFDQSGLELGRFSVPGLTSIAQDRRLDLLATGTFDTTINGNDYTLSTIYRIDLNKNGDYGINNASIKNKIVHPFYFKSGTPGSNDSLVTFRGIAPMADNAYYVSRNGPSNNIRQFGGPDDNVLFFGEDDVFSSPISVSGSGGVFRDYFKKPQGLATTAQPPQNPGIPNSQDFFFTSISPNTARKVQRINLFISDFGGGYEVANLAAGDTSRADRFLYDVERFDQPTDITIAGDGTNYIFVVDAGLDSLYQFNALGYEGVNPPPGSNTNKTIIVSLGGTGTGLTQFNNPQGVAYLGEIIYVADTGNGRILRFRLTTDFD